MRKLKILFLRILIYLRLYPHIYFSFTPFKIYEFEELLRDVTFSEDDIILDIGCSGGLKTLLLGKKCKKVVGIDISEDGIELAKLQSGYMKGIVNSEFRCVKLEDAGFEDEAFTKVFSICVLEHIANYVEILKESHRILRSGGQMVFSVDALSTIEDEELIAKHRRDHFVAKYFAREELKDLLEAAGFERVEVYPILKSDYAGKLFAKSITRGFGYGFLSSIFYYFLLKSKDRGCTDGDKGIFLVAKCYKSSRS